MSPTTKTIAVVNGTGRQAASLIRVASAVGFTVRAQVHSRAGLVAEELGRLPNVTLFEGSLLANTSLTDTLFNGAQLAFINTTSQAGDEVILGKALADAAKRSGMMQHFVYSSMPDHSVHNPRWPALPLWACKFAVENYIRQLGLPSTFVYAGIYNNNFTSLPYPLFCMELKDDQTFEWRAPFPPDIKLPWLDAEHDVGPAVLQIFKDGPKRWNGHRWVANLSLAKDCANPNLSIASRSPFRTLRPYKCVKHSLVHLNARATSSLILKFTFKCLSRLGTRSNWPASKSSSVKCVHHIFLVLNLILSIAAAFRTGRAGPRRLRSSLMRQENYGKAIEAWRNMREKCFQWKRRRTGGTG
jgi:hypothetical protein